MNTFQTKKPSEQALKNLMTKSANLVFIVLFSYDNHHKDIEMALMVLGATVTVHQLFCI